MSQLHELSLVSYINNKSSSILESNCRNNQRLISVQNFKFCSSFYVKLLMPTEWFSSRALFQHFDCSYTGNQTFPMTATSEAAMNSGSARFELA
jgi:hypothetical protein